MMLRTFRCIEKVELQARRKNKRKVFVNCWEIAKRNWSRRVLRDGVWYV